MKARPEKLGPHRQPTQPASTQPSPPPEISLTFSLFSLVLECLDHSAKRPFYYCAPNDIWSLGVVLVNLTCGRNPWKQASNEDSTYRAYTRSQGFLKTILPLSDELNDILGRIFTPNPDHRITLTELKARIYACSHFTEQPAGSTQPSSPVPISPESTNNTYVNADPNVDYVFGPPSPAASSEGSMSDADGSICSSDDESLSSSSSCSSMDELDHHGDFCQDAAEAMTPPPQLEGHPLVIYEPEDVSISNFQEYVHCPGPIPEPVLQQPFLQQPGLQHPVPMPVLSSHASKIYFPAVWEWVGKYAQPVHVTHPVVPFHHQVPMFALQGCY